MLNAHRPPGIETKIGNHTFRATGISAYLKNSGKLEIAQHIANHESPRTTKLYDSLKQHGQPVDDSLLQHLSPLGWEHINLTGDCVWKQNKGVERGKFRPLRQLSGLNVL